MPGERCWSNTGIKCCSGDASKPGEHIDATNEGNKYQVIVTERQVVAAVIEDIEGELSGCLGIDVQVPSAGDSGTGNLVPVAEECAARNCAVVRFRGLGEGKAR